MRNGLTGPARFGARQTGIRRARHVRRRRHEWRAGSAWRNPMGSSPRAPTRWAAPRPLLASADPAQRDIPHEASCLTGQRVALGARCLRTPCRPRRACGSGCGRLRGCRAGRTTGSGRASCPRGGAALRVGTVTRTGAVEVSAGAEFARPVCRRPRGHARGARSPRPGRHPTGAGAVQLAGGRGGRLVRARGWGEEPESWSW
jgi:hypothetical protein